ncbi:MAG: response regulator [Deltaproteobacteria bacterium]|nr:response regulator [Deltaproteobacteria bacterium]
MGITILAVDDSLLVTELVREYFTARGYRVFCAGNGREGLSLAERERPDLVLSDVKMPVMDGWELCRRLKAHPELRSVPVIFLTVEGEDHDVKKGIDLGASGYLTKPFSFDELRASVEAVLSAGGKDPYGLGGGEDAEEESVGGELAEVLNIFLEKRSTGTLLVSHADGDGAVAVRDGVIDGAMFGDARGVVALMHMASREDVRYRFGTSERDAGREGLPDRAGLELLGDIRDVAREFGEIVLSSGSTDPVLVLGPKYAGMDVTSLLDLSTAGFKRAGARKPAHGASMLSVFESVLRALKKGGARLCNLAAAAGPDGLLAVHVACHLVKRKIAVEKRL